MDKSFYTEDEIKILGLKSYGENVLISRFARIYDAGNITIGNNVRVDDFVLLSGKLKIGNFVHIAAYTALYGKSGITIEDFCNISARVLIYSVSDDYSGEVLTNPTMPDEYSSPILGMVYLSKHVIVGAGSVILPGVTAGEGVAIGALSMVNRDLEPWNIYGGVPVRLIKKRSKKLLDLERALLDETF